MASVYKRRHRRPDGTLAKSRCWYYALVDATGARVVRKGYTDKEATQALARREERAAERVRAGLDCGPEAYATTQLEPFVEEWLADVRRSGKSVKYAYWLEHYFNQVRETIGWRRLGDLNKDELITLLNNLTGVSDRTANAHRDALHAFCRYAMGRGWLASDPTAGISRTNRGKGLLPKRPFIRDEVRRLVELSGFDYGNFYLIAALSGLRHQELRALRWGNVELGAKPRWRLSADATKAGRPDVVPMLPECAVSIEDLVARCDAFLIPHRHGDRIFPHPPTFKRWKQDAVAAGLDLVTDRGRLTFHSLRYFFCTELARVLPIQRVRQLMRHAKIQTTLDLYCKLGIDDLFDEFPNLPKILE